MFIWTAKLHRGRLIAGTVGVVAVMCGVLVAAGLLGKASTASAQVSPKGVRTAEDRLEYLAAYGWQVKEEPLAVEELLIPKELGPEYTDYLALQSQQGFDLSKYAGKAVRRYTYEITNYPTGEAGVQVSLLLYRDTVVGGDVLSPALNGFIHGLEMPSAQTNV